MRRSEINAAIDEAIAFFKGKNFPLPQYAAWSPADWAARGGEYREVREVGLGWDVTDFGSGDFARTGRAIFTLRNGKRGDPRHTKPYAQKVMHLRAGQKSIIHYHRAKMEDICNQGGGVIAIRLWPVGPDSRPAQSRVEVSISGRLAAADAGETLRIGPGEWICLPPLLCHQFWADEDAGDVLSIEVSSACDDRGDNVFPDGGERFPRIEEDEPKKHVLCTETPQNANT